MVLQSVRRAAGGFLYQTLLVDDFGHLWEDLSGDNVGFRFVSTKSLFTLCMY
jgi:hypothetical protein